MCTFFLNSKMLKVAYFLVLKKREQKLISVSSSLSFNLICSASFGHFLSLKRGLPVYGKHVKELARLTGRLATKSLVCIAKTFFCLRCWARMYEVKRAGVECSECNWCTIWTMLFLISGKEHAHLSCLSQIS